MFLRILSGALSGQSFELQEGENTIGRSDECDIVISLAGVSKKHAKIEFSQGRIVLTDLGSSNGTFVNGIRIKQKEIKATDRIGIHNCLLDIKPQVRPSANERPSAGPSPFPNFEAGSLAPQHNPSPTTNIHLAPTTEAQATESPSNFFETIRQYVDTVAMPGVYRLIEIFEFKNVIASMILGFILLMTIFSVIPMMNITKDSVEKESRRRALTIAKNLAISNQPLLQQGSEAAVSTRAAENEEGVQSALIVSNRDGRTIAPLTNAGGYANLPFVHKARKINRESVEQIDDELIGASYPIFAYNPESGQQVIAHAVVLYNMGSLAIDSQRYISLFTQILVISLLLGGLLYFFIYKLHQQPLVDINAQLDAALKDDRKTVENKYLIPELTLLVTNISSALNRAMQGGSQAPRVDRTLEAQNIVQMLANPSMTLDKDRVLISVNSALEDLMGMRQATLQGQTLEILSDQALRMSITDLLDQATPQAGMIVSNLLDFSGVPYEIDVQAILGAGEVSYFLVSMKRKEDGQ
jgi:hypothetical protein